MSGSPPVKKLYVVLNSSVRSLNLLDAHCGGESSVVEQSAGAVATPFPVSFQSVILLVNCQ